MECEEKNNIASDENRERSRALAEALDEVIKCPEQRLPWPSEGYPILN